MNSQDETSIHRAVMRNSLGEVVEALSGGKTVDAVDEEKRTPLFYAAKDGNLLIIDELLRAKADVNAKDQALETPLHFAAREYQLEAAQRLVEAGADPNAQDCQGNTPLWRAVFESRGRGGMITLLLSAGADKRLKNRHNSSSQDLAESIGNYDVTVFLR